MRCRRPAAAARGRSSRRWRSCTSASAIALPLVFIIGNRDNSNAQVGGIKLTASMQGRSRAVRRALRRLPHARAPTTRGRQDRAEPRQAAAARGADREHDRQRLPAAAGVSDARTNCLGYGTMPADIVGAWQDIVQVAGRCSGRGRVQCRVRRSLGTRAQAAARRKPSPSSRTARRSPTVKPGFRVEGPIPAHFRHTSIRGLLGSRLRQMLNSRLVRPPEAAGSGGPKLFGANRVQGNT